MRGEMQGSTGSSRALREGGNLMTYYDLSEDIRAAYADLDAISKNYPLEMDGVVLRFRKNRAVCFMAYSANLNDLLVMAYHQEWPIEDVRMLYRMMGYSLGGFCELFSDGGIYKGLPNICPSCGTSTLGGLLCVNCDREARR
jgi:hypothetical protein